MTKMDREMRTAMVGALVENRLRPGALPHLENLEHIGGLAAGYDLQDEVHAGLERAGFGSITGHKIGCTTRIMQEFMAIPHPCSGGVFENTVFRSGAVIAPGQFHAPGVECEIAVRLARDITDKTSPFSRENIGDFVASVMPAIEIVDNRYADFRNLGTPLLVADDFFDAGCVLGSEIEDWQSLAALSLPESARARTVINEVQAGRGCAADVLGHPFEALAWFANHATARGEVLKTGAFVLLGSMVEVQWCSPGDHVTIEIDGFERLEIKFEPT